MFIKWQAVPLVVKVGNILCNELGAAIKSQINLGRTLGLFLGNQSGCCLLVQIGRRFHSIHFQALVPQQMDNYLC